MLFFQPEVDSDNGKCINKNNTYIQYTRVKRTPCWSIPRIWRKNNFIFLSCFVRIRLHSKFAKNANMTPKNIFVTTFWLFFILYITCSTFIPSLSSVVIRWGSSPSLHRWSAQWEKPRWGAEPRIEVRPALPYSTHYQNSKLTHYQFLFIFIFIFLGDFLIFFVHYSALLHLPPLRFHCAAGIEPKTVATGALAVRRSNH